MTRFLAPAILAATFAWGGAALGEDLEFVLINESSSPLVGFFVSPASSNNWDENLLEGKFLPPNHEITVGIADGLTTCVYDIRGVFEDNSSVEDMDLNLCELGKYTFTD